MFLVLGVDRRRNGCAGSFAFHSACTRSSENEGAVKKTIWRKISRSMYSKHRTPPQRYACETEKLLVGYGGDPEISMNLPHK